MICSTGGLRNHHLGHAGVPAGPVADAVPAKDGAIVARLLHPYLLLGRSPVCAMSGSTAHSCVWSSAYLTRPTVLDVYSYKTCAGAAGAARGGGTAHSARQERRPRRQVRPFSPIVLLSRHPRHRTLPPRRSPGSPHTTQLQRLERCVRRPLTVADPCKFARTAAPARGGESCDLTSDAVRSASSP